VSSKSDLFEEDHEEDELDDDSDVDNGLDDSIWIELGENEGHITNRAIVNQNI